MATAKLTLDFDTRKFFDGTGASIQTLSGKKDSIREYELTITQGGVPLSLPAGTTVKAAMKKTTSPAGTLLVEADSVRVGWGTGSRWIFTLDLSGDAFGTSGVLGTNVDFEVLMDLPDGQHIPSITVPFAIQKNVML
jgi:hypothetical protein